MKKLTLMLFILVLFGSGIALINWLWLNSYKKTISSQHLIVALGAEPRSLDPRQGTDANSMRISNLLFQSMVQLNSNQELVPSAATSWKYDNKIYTFLINKHIHFSNGRQLTAKDILFSFQEYRSKKNPFSGAFQIIESVTVDNKSNKKQFLVKVQLKAPSAKFLQADLPVLKILPKQETLATGTDFYKNPIGTGPFYLKNHTSSKIVLAARRDIPNPPHIDYVTFKIIRDNFTLFQKTLNGEIDIVQSELPLDKIHWFKNSKQFQVFQAPGSSISYLLINFKHPCLQKKQLRQVLAWSINRSEIIQYKLHNMARSASSLLTSENFFFNTKIKNISFKQPYARQVLHQLSHCKDQILSLKSSRSKLATNMVQVIARGWNQMGLKVQINSYEWGRFYKDLEMGQFQTAFLQWTGIIDPDIYRVAFHSKEHSPQGRNRGFYMNQSVDSLLDQGLLEMDRQKRKIIYDQVQQIIAEDLAFIPLWHNDQIAVVKTNIKHYYLSSLGDLNYLTVVKKINKN